LVLGFLVFLVIDFHKGRWRWSGVRGVVPMASITKEAIRNGSRFPWLFVRLKKERKEFYMLHGQILVLNARVAFALF
jgi:hypothetical protein